MTDRLLPELRHLFDFDAGLEPPVVIDTRSPVRRMVPITGGTVSGRYTGRLLPGQDWQIVTANGSVEISAHYILDLDGHGLVEVQSKGLRAGPPEVLAALLAGEIVPATRYYFRTALRFRTNAGGLLHLNDIIAIGAGTRFADRVILNVYEVT